jgi:apolipoprotein N-acyltransferase
LFTRDAGISTVPLRTSLTPASHWGGPFALMLEVLAVLIGLGAMATRSSRTDVR